MAWEGIHEDDFGWVGKLTITQDGIAVNISTYTTRQFVFRKPSGVLVTKTAVFDTDGTDGVLAYTVEAAVFDAPGQWQVQARIAKTGVELSSKPHIFDVAKRLS